MLKVYSIEECTWCAKVKRYLQQKGVEYLEINVEEYEQAFKEMLRISGQQTVPVLEKDGQVVVGFDKKQIDELLQA